MIYPISSGPHVRTRFLAHVRTRKEASPEHAFLAHVRTRKEASPEHAFLVSRAHAQDALLVSPAHAHEFVGWGSLLPPPCVPLNHCLHSTSLLKLTPPSVCH